MGRANYDIADIGSLNCYFGSRTRKLMYPRVLIEGCIVPKARPQGASQHDLMYVSKDSTDAPNATQQVLCEAHQKRSERSLIRWRTMK
jgi:hypothetical protein